MKRLLCSLISVALIPIAVSVTITWDSQPDADAFYVYQTDDLQHPFAVVARTVSNSCTFPLAPGQHFFVVTASNFWGESSFSDTVKTANVVTPVTGTKIQRAP